LPQEAPGTGRSCTLRICSLDRGAQYRKHSGPCAPPPEWNDGLQGGGPSNCGSIPSGASLAFGRHTMIGELRNSGPIKPVTPLTLWSTTLLKRRGDLAVHQLEAMEARADRHRFPAQIRLSFSVAGLDWSRRRPACPRATLRHLRGAAPRSHAEWPCIPAMHYRWRQ